MTMQSAAIVNTCYQAKKDAISCDLEGEAVLMQLGSGTYYGLNAVGAEIWKFIQDKQSFVSIQQHLLSLYDVTEEQCKLEVRSFLDRMTQQNLIECHSNESTA